MNDHKRKRRRRNRKQRKQRPAPKPMATEIQHLLPEPTVKELRRIANRKRKRRA
ncbi:hypothetical protein [Rossellomorea sp. LjRoot5]|uniref:hypothetical protein n=1 Tax=Rossellomorea sp. LjRoot5 TaxID=3342331 RepID=UPI003ECF5775